MSVLKFCVGSRAERPYYMKSMHIRIYSMEELCYYMWENASLLDEEILKEELIQWIDKECKMEQLAKQLYEICHFDGSIHAFVNAVLTAAGFREPEEIKLLEKRIRTYEGMSRAGREKAQADHLFLSGRYVAAMERYMALIEKTEPLAKNAGVEEKRFLTLLYHNVATVFARLFFYEEAAAFYERAFELGEESELKYALMCKRMICTPVQFEVFVREHAGYKERAYEAEQMMNDGSAQWMAAEERINLEAAAALKETGKTEEAAAILQDKVEEWEKEYHTYVMR